MHHAYLKKTGVTFGVSVFPHTAQVVGVPCNSQSMDLGVQISFSLSLIPTPLPLLSFIVEVVDKVLLSAWFMQVSVIFATGCFVLLVEGAFLLLYSGTEGMYMPQDSD